jgi:diguanylate cyclase (GGDEF)-like protein
MSARSSTRRRRAEDTSVVLASPAVSGSVIGLHAEMLNDDLTGLGSLLTLREHLQGIIDRYQPFGIRPALLLIDVDRFAELNRTYGPLIGDHILLALAGRLRSMVPGGNSTYRTGGDEFVALLDSVPMVDAVAAAGEIQQALSRPVDLEQSVVPVTVSVAVVMLGYRQRVDALLRDADVTMYRAKTEGGNRVDLYNWELDSWSSARKRDAERLQQDADRLHHEVETLRRQNRQLVEALTVDLATGMPNGVSFERDHVQLEAWRKRTSEPYSVLRLRIAGVDEARDDFLTGDGRKALTDVAHAVRDTVRLSDRAFVLGDGDLGVLLRGATMKQALAAAGRVQAAVDKVDARHPVDPERRLSLVIAAIEAGYRHPGRDEVMKEVNDLLRQAVRDGGERKIVWPH